MSATASPLRFHPRAQTSVNAASESPDLVRGLYVHVPFCAHKCEYCAFYSAPPSGDIIERFVGALVKELELIAPHCRPETVFFGGGTPSLLTLRQWETILRAMERLNLLGAAEWTVECNPATVSADKAALLRRFGVNRISMGVQSLDETLLDRLGRIHSRDQVFRSHDILREAGFDNLNIDLMFAIPSQTLELWHRTLDEALALGTEHLSCYEVIYEDDTPLFHQLQAGEFDVDEALACTMYDALIDRCAADGLRQYEIANFARDHHVIRGGPRPDGPATSAIPALACRHNVGYWRGRDYFGIGPSASESIQGKRSKNWSNTTLWIERLERGRRAQEWTESLTPLGRAGELAAFGLRMNAGWPFEEFAQRTGFDLRGEWRDNLNTMVQRDWAEETADAFRLNRTGLRYADAAAELMLR